MFVILVLLFLIVFVGPLFFQWLYDTPAIDWLDANIPIVWNAIKPIFDFLGKYIFGPIGRLISWGWGHGLIGKICTIIGIFLVLKLLMRIDNWIIRHKDRKARIKKAKIKDDLW